MQNEVVLFFDTETTGFEYNGQKIPTHDLNQYITQLSFILVETNTFNVLEVFNSYVNIPENVIIPEKVMNITKITPEHCRNGKSVVECLWRFYLAWLKCDKVVAHNFDFDIMMITNEIIRYKHVFCKDYVDDNIPHRGINILLEYRYQISFSPRNVYLRNNPKEAVCTMKETTDYCNLILNNRPKWPKLIELYRTLFNEEPPGPLHNAIIDTLVGLRCYLKHFKAKTIHIVKFHHMIKQCMELS